jgi:hypothetical protein
VRKILDGILARVGNMFLSTPADEQAAIEEHERRMLMGDWHEEDDYDHSPDDPSMDTGGAVVPFVQDDSLRARILIRVISEYKGPVTEAMLSLFSEQDLRWAVNIAKVTLESGRSRNAYNFFRGIDKYYAVLRYLGR